MKAHVIIAILAIARLAGAQEIPCTGSSAERCSYGITLPSAGLVKAPTLFKLQARLSQAKLPLGDTTLPSVTVNLLRGRDVLCQESMANVKVQESVLDLTVGKNMSCDLDVQLARHADLAFQVCIGTGNCLKPLPLGQSPYAITATYASFAREAKEANTAVQSNWARFVTADRDLQVRNKIGTGYFDFGTVSPQLSLSYYTTTTAFDPHDNGGFLLWTPVRQRDGWSLHISGKDARSDRLTPLDELVLATNALQLPGTLRVSPPVGGVGLQVTRGTAAITGSATIDGTLHLATGTSIATGDLDVKAGGVHITGTVMLGGTVLVTDGLTADGGLHITGDAVIGGALDITGEVTFGAGGMAVVGDSSVGAFAVGDDATIGGNLVVDGAALFKGFAQLEAGASGGGGIADTRYVGALAETRPVTFRGATTFQAAATLGGPLALAGYALFDPRLAVAASPPFGCDAAHLGAFYAEPVANTVQVCINGTWSRLVAAACGDGRVTGKEECDDKNRAPGDGCSDTCVKEFGYVCSGQPSVCVKPCGDGKVDPGEGCDDGAKVDGDGCGSTCQIESPWQCSGQPSVCHHCGNAKLEPPEVCDIGSSNGVYGCNSSCSGTMPNWRCEQACGFQKPGYSNCASSCYHCGNGYVDSGEGCDDGNFNSGDGCAGCQIEGGWQCANRPNIGCNASSCIRWPGYGCNLWIIGGCQVYQGCQNRLTRAQASAACTNVGNKLVNVTNIYSAQYVNEIAVWHNTVLPDGQHDAMWIGSSYENNGSCLAIPWYSFSTITPVCAQQLPFVCEKGP